jgi:hypothetical protein
LLQCGDTGLKFGHFNPIITNPDRRQNIRLLPLTTPKRAGRGKSLERLAG